MQTINFVDNPAALQALSAGLAASPWIAVDTEFERSRTYYPQLCLLQVADAHRVACIDPLAIDDLGPIAAVLSNPAVLKVFHAAGQDLEVLHQHLGILPAPVFDTQLAAALLGYPEQLGYAQLVEATVGVKLEKAHTRADWSKRPLSAAELEYAGDDVRYLRGAYETLATELEKRGRGHWLDEELTALTDPKNYEIEPGQAFRRLRGWRKLRPAQQQILRRLAAWREREAMTKDRPRRWVMKDEVLLDIARRRPGSREALAKTRGLSDKNLKCDGKRLLQEVKAGNEAPAETLGQARQPLPAEQAPVVDALMAVLKQCAQEAELAPALLAGRQDLERLVAGERELPLLGGWRRHAAGARLLALLEGEIAFSVENGKLKLHP